MPCADRTQPKVEVKHISHAPALTVESVVPAAFSSASRLAPEELHSTKTDKDSGIVTHGRGRLVAGTTEVTSDERRRVRNARKRSARLERKRTETAEARRAVDEASGEAAMRQLRGAKNITVVGAALQKQVYGKKAGKKAASAPTGPADTTKYTSSAAVFRRLQDDQEQRAAGKERRAAAAAGRNSAEAKSKSLRL